MTVPWDPTLRVILDRLPLILALTVTAGHTLVPMDRATTKEYKYGKVKSERNIQLFISEYSKRNCTRRNITNPISTLRSNTIVASGEIQLWHLVRGETVADVR